MKDPEEPFADQLEWQRHRYDPGHFLGGTLVLEYRPSLGARAKRVVAVMLMAKGIGLLVLSIAVARMAGHFPGDPYTTPLAAISFLGGVKVWRSASRGEQPTREEANEAAGRLYRVAGMVLLGASLTALLVLVLVSLTAALMAALRGAAGVIAALAVLVAVALLIRQKADAAD